MINTNFINKCFLGVLSATFVLGLSNCEVDDNQSVPERQWQLTWSDEFDGAAGQSPDSTKWKYDIGRGPGGDGWGSAELQYYTDRPENVAMDGEGNLVITARAETFGGAAYSSARIKTQGLFDQAYGRFEARMKTPYGPGLWPAFWMLGNDFEVEVAWPFCGEIDIMELRGQVPNVIAGSVHGPGYSGGGAITADFALFNSRFDTEYHIFAIEWGENYIDYFVDDALYFRLTPDDVPGDWVFDHPFFVILNVAVGGNYVGFPNVNTPFPQTMTVDYVRVYQEVK